MSEQAIEILEGGLGIGVSAGLSRFKRMGAAAATVIIALYAGSGALEAQTKPAANTSTQNVNVVNTPTVNVASMPAVSISGTPTVNVASVPPVSIAGTPTVNANVTFPANQAVTVAAAGPLTNVGRLPSQQVALIPGVPVGCTTAWAQVTMAGTISCFDMANLPGQVLVVTDFYWEGEGPAGTNCVAYLLGPGPAWYLIKSGAVVASDGFISKSEHLTTGAVMSGNPSYHGIPGGACGIFDTELHGYLLPNQ